MGFKIWLVYEEYEPHIKVPVPSTNQHHSFDCGAAALRAVCQFFNVGPKEQSEFIKACDTSSDKGTRPKDIIRVARKFGLMTRAQHNMPIETLKEYLDIGIPVICPIQAHGEKEDYPDRWSGHYVVAIGYDSRNIYFEDPMLKENSRGFLSTKEFLKRWIDEDIDGWKYDNFGIAIWKPDGDVKPEADKKSSKAIP